MAAQPGMQSDRSLRGSRGIRAKRRRAAWRRFFSGVLESLAIVAVFVVAGLAWAAVASQIEGRDESPRPVYSLPAMEESEASIWLVDGYNVLHAGVLGGRDRSQWWTASRRRELLERVAGFEQAAELWIVFDGPEDPGADLTQPGPRCVFALSADDWLVDRVRRSDDPSQIAVVTADRQVAGRARSRGAQIVSPAEFLSRCTS